MLRYSIWVDEKTKELDSKKLAEFKSGEILLDGIRINTKQPTMRALAGNLKIYANDVGQDVEANNYLKIQFNNWFEYGNSDSKITLEYGHTDIDGRNFEVVYSNEFGLEIESSNSEIDEPTECGIIFTKEHELKNVGGEITFDENGAKFNNGVPSYFRFTGKAPKKMKGLPQVSEKPNMVKVTSISRDENNNPVENFWFTAEINEKGNFTGIPKYIKAYKIIYDSNGKPIKKEEKYAGKVEISAKDDGTDYLKIKISDWQRFSGDVSESIKIEYVSTDGKNITTTVRTDILDFGVNAPNEKIPPETDGTLRIFDTGGINQAELTLKNGVLTTIRDGDDAFYEPKDKAVLIGEFPKKLIINKEEADWEKYAFIRLRKKNDHSFYYTWNLITSSNFSFEVELGEGVKPWQKATVKFEIRTGEENLVLTFDKLKTDFNYNYDEEFELVYFISDDKEGEVKIKEIKKIDTFRLVINTGTKPKAATITVENPIVWYNYNSSNAISNIAHDKCVHLANNEEKTLNRDGGLFLKNTKVNGEQWIKGDGILDYDYQMKRHKVNIIAEQGEVIKYTNDNGGTNSSTFITFKGEVSERPEVSLDRDKKSVIMFSYDGGNKYLNFGVAKYEFRNTKQATEVIILHGEKMEQSSKIRVELPAFDGRPYVSPSYDIQPEKDYTKAYQFDDSIGQNPVTIDYGTVGFKDLDIRITYQSGGDGIELRAYEMVDLINETETYVIKGAKLFFENGIREKADIISDRTYFKGENEKSTFKNLKLWIPTQESIIPKSRFKIVKTGTKNEAPLEVGVSVRNGEEFYKPVADLYLDLTDKRYIETEITFENPSISTENSGSEEDWIYLNKGKYPAGKLVGRDDTTIWGTITGDIIDIPVNHINLKNKRIILEIFTTKENIENILTNDLAKIDRLSFDLEEGTGRAFLLKYVDKEDYIRFSLNKGYDDKNCPKDIEFYVRYYSEENDGKKQFLFDHKYIVKFAKKVDYLGDTTIRFKNPIEITTENNKYEEYINGNDDYGYDTSNNKFGRVKLENIGIAVEESKDHSKLEYDKIVWWEVGNSVVYPGTTKAKYESGYEVISGNKRQIYINHIGGKNIDIRPYLSFDTTATTRVLKIGVPDNINIPVAGTKSTYELNFNGDKYRLKMEIAPFDPTYYGRVYPAIETFTQNDEYQNINIVGSSSRSEKENIFSPIVEGEYIYIDLGTKYRDYLRYEGVYNKVGSMKVLVGSNFSQAQEVEIIPKDNVSAPIIKGKLIFKGNGTKFENEKQVKLFSTNSQINEEPIEYLLQVKVDKNEYKKLQPNTKYEIYVNGNKNILNIGTKDKVSELKLNEALNFTTVDSGIEVDAEILDFGNIGLNFNNGQDIITQDGKAKVTVKSSIVSMDRIKLELESPEADLFYVIGEEENGQVDESVWLDVTNLKVEKQQTLQRQNTQIENYELSGIVNVKNNERTKLGVYNGNIILNVVLNPPQTK